MLTFFFFIYLRDPKFELSLFCSVRCLEVTVKTWFSLTYILCSIGHHNFNRNTFYEIIVSTLGSHRVFGRYWLYAGNDKFAWKPGYCFPIDYLRTTLLINILFIIITIIQYDSYVHNLHHKVCNYKTVTRSKRITYLSFYSLYIAYLL